MLVSLSDGRKVSHYSHQRKQQEEGRAAPASNGPFQIGGDGRGMLIEAPEFHPEITLKLNDKCSRSTCTGIRECSFLSFFGKVYANPRKLSSSFDYQTVSFQSHSDVLLP